MRRVRRSQPILGALSGAALFGIASVAFACADVTSYPIWRLAAPAYDNVGRPAMTPGNDTRMNLLWLMRSLHPVSDAGAAYPKPDWTTAQFGHSFLTWPSLRATYWPSPVQSDASSAACTPPADAAAAFSAALAADKAVPAEERTALTALRNKVGCGTVDWTAPVASAQGREFLAYLKASAAFYANDWPGARAQFADLTQAQSPWIAETAAYMPIRIALRQAVAGAFDQYGNFGGTDKVDAVAVAAAKTAIAAYLKAWPRGRYAASAQGLTRRVLWLKGDIAGLAHVYEHLAATTPPDREVAADLAEEIDNDLLSDKNADETLRQPGDMPLLQAIWDLRQMRTETTDGGAVKMLAAADLAAQRQAFGKMGDLYGFLQATRAFYAGDPPAGLLAAIPEDVRAPGATPLAFSRQVLRGMALAKAGDPGEERFWTGLIAGARPLYQRPFAEIGLAVHWQRAGRLEAIFAPGSPVEDQMTREIVLQTIAPPTILRGAATNSARGAHERDVARFILLYKDLSRQAYGDFGRDLALVPIDAQAESFDFATDNPVAVGLFTKGKWSDGFACPALAQTAATLARSPTDPGAQLCLGDFWRLNGFDGFAPLDTGHTSFGNVQTGPDTLGNAPDGFPGKPLYRDAIYAAILTDPRAAPGERAYALYRAVMCYAPAGYNGCAGPFRSADAMDKASVPKTQRQAWYLELKKRYPDSRWAKALRYYW